VNRDVVFVLLLVQAGAGLLASTGELALMGSPLYLIVPIVKATAVVVIASRVARDRGWAIVAAVVVQWLGLLGMWFGLALGVVSPFSPTLTLTGLLTELALPLAVILLCVPLLARRPTRTPPPPPRPPAPFPPPAPVRDLVTTRATAAGPSVVVR
jgi:hypothetical protein